MESRRELHRRRGRVDQLFQPAWHAVLVEREGLALGEGLLKPYKQPAASALFVVAPCFCAITAHQHRSRPGRFSGSQQPNRADIISEISLGIFLTMLADESAVWTIANLRAIPHHSGRHQFVVAFPLRHCCGSFPCDGRATTKLAVICSGFAASPSVPTPTAICQHGSCSPDLTGPAHRRLHSSCTGFCDLPVDISNLLLVIPRLPQLAGLEFKANC